MLAHNQAPIYARGTKGLCLVRAQRQIEATSNKTRHSNASDTREDSETSFFGEVWRGGMFVPDTRIRGRVPLVVVNRIIQDTCHVYDDAVPRGRFNSRFLCQAKKERGVRLNCWRR